MRGVSHYYGANMPYVEVWVDDSDVLEDASNEDLIKEMERRNLPTLAETDEAKDDLNRIFYAFYFGKEQEAVNVMRKYVQDVTGKTLP
jgi:hypothetical protein